MGWDKTRGNVWPMGWDKTRGNDIVKPLLLAATMLTVYVEYHYLSDYMNFHSCAEHTLLITITRMHFN